MTGLYTKDELNKLVEELQVADAITILRKLHRVHVINISEHCKINMHKYCDYKTVCICSCHLDEELVSGT